jgi:hypothetical protein
MAQAPISETAPQEMAAVETKVTDSESSTPVRKQVPSSKKRNSDQKLKNNKRAEGTKKKASKNSERVVPLTTERLCEIWVKIAADPRARRALKRLDQAGFRISHMKPMDATFNDHPCWADYIAAVPLVPNKPSTRPILYSFRKNWHIVRQLRRLAFMVNLPFAEVIPFYSRDYTGSAKRSSLGEDLLKAASMLEHLLSTDYSVRFVNPRNALIAELRWAIRHATRKPHDRDLNALIDAAFRAAGYEEGCYIEPTTLDRIEKRQKESRVKAYRRILTLMGASA